MKSPPRWPWIPLALGVAVPLAACGPAIPDAPEKGGDKTAQADKPGQASGPSVAHEADGSIVLHLPKEDALRLGISVGGVALPGVQPGLKAYGRIVERPDAAFTLRAPLAGVVRAANEAAWPKLGAEIAAGTILGSIEPRLSAVERADVAARVAAARGDVASMTASLAAAESALKRAQALNAQDKNVSDRVVQEADALVQVERAKLAASRSAVETLEALLEPSATSKAALPLVVGRAGEVVDLLVMPGENVDAGAPILKISNYEEVLARVELPIEGGFDAAAEVVQIRPFDREDVWLAGRRRGLDARVDPSTLGRAWLVSIAAPADGKPDAWRALGLRPGLAVVAILPRAPSGVAAAGSMIPASAVVRHAGRVWAWMQTDEETYVRRPLDSSEPTSAGWFTTATWAKDAHLVATGAQALLSTELVASQKSGSEEP